jgi:hypothetical protein
MTARIENIDGCSSSHKLAVKRFYLPFRLVDTCPKCSRTVERNFDTDGGYLSYPVLNKPETVSLWCDDCGVGWLVALRLDFRLTVVTEAGDASSVP